MEEYVKDCIDNIVNYRACVLNKPEYTIELKHRLKDLAISYDSALNIEGFEVLRVS